MGQGHVRKQYRVIALLMSALMLISLPGCGVFSTHLARAIQKISKTENLRFELSVTADLELSVADPDTAAAEDGGGKDERAQAENARTADLSAAEETADTPETAGRSIPMQASFSASGALFADPLLVRADSVLTLPGSELRSENYIEKVDSAYYLYSRINDGTFWQKQGLAEREGESVKGLKTIVRVADSFSAVGAEIVHGSVAERYDGLVSGEYLSELFSLYRVWEVLTEEYGLQLQDGLLSAPEDIPASIWLDQESGMIVRVEADLTKFADKIASSQLRSSRNALGLDALGLELTLTGLALSVDLSDFDHVDEFQIPDEAKAAWGEDIMPWDR